MERETGIEPATNSLEGCDSTTELLPPPRLARLAPLSARRGRRAHLRSPHALVPSLHGRASLQSTLSQQPLSSVAHRRRLRDAGLPSRNSRRAKAGGEGRIRTFEALGRQIYSLLRLTASLPRRVSRAAAWPASDVPSDARASPGGRTIAPVRARTRARCKTRRRPGNTRSRARCLCGARPGTWSWRRDLNPRPADYKSAALPD